jgi:hypothetical protein
LTTARTIYNSPFTANDTTALAKIAKIAKEDDDI